CEQIARWPCALVLELEILARAPILGHQRTRSCAIPDEPFRTAIRPAIGPPCAVAPGVLASSGQRSHEIDVDCRWFITLDFSLVNAGRRARSPRSFHSQRGPCAVKATAGGRR